MKSIFGYSRRKLLSDGLVSLIYFSPKRSKSVLVCGLAASGSLYINTSPPEISSPRLAEFFKRKTVKHIAAGFGFSVCSSKNCIYGAGINIFDNLSIKNPSLHWLKSDCGGVFKIDMKEKVVSLSAGRRHFLVATEDNVYSFGDNTHGQCGFDPKQLPFLLPNKDELNEPLRIPSSSKVQQVHCSFDTSFILLKSGEIFSFGLGTDGQLGRGLMNYDWKCLPFGENLNLSSEKITSINGSSDTLMAVSNGGRLFMWGQNEYGQMKAFCNKMQVHEPLEIKLDIGKVIQAASTATSCIVLSSTGHVYVWGFGILGLGPNVTCIHKPMLIDSNIFRCGLNDNGKVKDIFAGNISMFAISDNDNLFSWGVNRYCHLGLGHKKDQFFPFQVNLRSSPRSVSVAPDHTLIFVK